MVDIEVTTFFPVNIVGCRDADTYGLIHDDEPIIITIEGTN